MTLERAFPTFIKTMQKRNERKQNAQKGTQRERENRVKTMPKMEKKTWEKCACTHVLWYEMRREMRRERVKEKKHKIKIWKQYSEWKRDKWKSDEQKCHDVRRKARCAMTKKSIYKERENTIAHWTSPARKVRTILCVRKCAVKTSSEAYSARKTHRASSFTPSTSAGKRYIGTHCSARVRHRAYEKDRA